MTSAWWVGAPQIAPPEPQNRDLPALQVTDGPEGHPAPEHLLAPQGRIWWVCVTPAGGKSAWDSEAEAEERAKDNAGSVVYPVRVEEEMTA